MSFQCRAYVPNSDTIQILYSQSAYKKLHCTETALKKVFGDVLNMIDQQQVVLLALSDLSPAFDTCDHGIFLNRL